MKHLLAQFNFICMLVATFMIFAPVIRSPRNSLVRAYTQGIGLLLFVISAVGFCVWLLM